MGSMSEIVVDVVGGFGVGKPPNPVPSSNNARLLAMLDTAEERNSLKVTFSQARDCYEVSQKESSE